MTNVIDITSAKDKRDLGKKIEELNKALAERQQNKIKTVQMIADEVGEVAGVIKKERGARGVLYIEIMQDGSLFIGACEMSKAEAVNALQMARDTMLRAGL